MYFVFVFQIRPLHTHNWYIMCNIWENMSQCSMNQTPTFTAASNNGESYWEKSLGFLIIGIIGILANGFVIIILGSSVKIRQKLVNTLIIHQSFVDFLASVALMGTAHLRPMIHMAWKEFTLTSIVTLWWVDGHYGS